MDEKVEGEEVEGEEVDAVISCVDPEATPSVLLSRETSVQPLSATASVLVPSVQVMFTG